VIGTVSHYRLVEPLGVGGMGVVYEAYDTRTGRPVALKFVDVDRLDDQDGMRRLKREAEMMAMLKHPHICSIHEVGEHEGCPYIAMERLHGMSLKLYIARRPLSTAAIVRITLQLTAALEAAHRVGIVHRDVKPGNVFVCRSGVVKVFDFGLARRFADDDQETAGGSTMPGRPIGTANYMAPERLLQMAVDPRSDLFSLGVVIYEMATERLPFAARSQAETAFNVMASDPTPLRDLSPRPRALERIVQKLLSKEPCMRYQSAAELRAALLNVPVGRKARHEALC